MKKILICLLCVLLFATCFMLGCGEQNGSSDSSTKTDNSTQTSDTSDSSGSGEIDKSKFPNYVEEGQAVYKFNDAEKVTPYWTGNVIYNETVMLIDDGKTVSGKLQYTPTKILSVRDYTWKNEYTQGTDYTVNGKVISIDKTQSTIPYLTSENLEGENMPAGYRKVDSISNVETDWVWMGCIYTEGSLIYGHQVSVSYCYDVKELKTENFASYSTSGLTKLKAKLNAKEDVKVVVTGDSISEGCSSSLKFNHEPYLPNFMQLSTTALAEKYGCKVTLDNQSKGGMTSDWATNDDRINAMIAAKPDVLFIHFGVNDLGAQNTASMYQDNIESIILKVQASVPNCEFVIIKAFGVNPNVYDYDKFSKYWSKADALAESLDNVYTLDMFSLSKTMFEVKKYEDVTGNGINHLNDYTTRLYAMNILSSLVDYNK